MLNCAATPSIPVRVTDVYDLYVGNKNYSSWSLRAWILLRELNIPFREIVVPFGGAQNPGAFRAFSPTGKVPCLVDGATTVWDSLAITEYLAERHGGVWPADAPARAWARCAAAEMHSGFQALRNICGMNCGLRIRLHSIDASLAGDLRRIEQLWAEGLAKFGGPFLTGARFCAADAFFAPVAFRIQTYDPPIDAASRRYAAQLRDLPGMREWYAAGLAETWRDPEHEAEVSAFGTWTQDLRAR
jgi:glutathione S-transferase